MVCELFGLSSKPSRDLLVTARQEAGCGDAERAKQRLSSISDFAMLAIDDEARFLAEKLLSANAIPEDFPEDALHLAVAAVNGMDIVITWNFAHLHNPFTRKRIRKVIENEGYPAPEICSPDELMEADG